MSSSTKVAKIQAEDTMVPHRTMWQDTFSRLRRNPSARFGGMIVLVMIGLAVLIPIVDDYDPVRDNNLRARYTEPDCVIGWFSALTSGELTDENSTYEFTCEYPFGADKSGRDILRRVGHGMSVSLSVSVLVVILALFIGTGLGISAGFFGGWTDTVIMRFMDIILAFPALLLAIVLVTIFGSGLTNGMIAIAVTQVPIYARLSRSMAISIRNMEYVQAARSLGGSEWRILWRHVLPNSLSPLIVQSTLLMGTAVIETAALGFLGLGQQPPYPELGKMLADSQQSMYSGKWWVMIFPGVTIVLIVLGFNLLGDGFRDALDPRLKR